MYKVLLVDDEVLTREAISQNIRWEAIGFRLIGTAENGKEALQIVEEESPDLVLTDICMPVMDGIALSQHLHEHYPDIRVVIISGYDDFEYAKQAIRFGVSNYILKPVTSRELTEELEKMKDKIEGFYKKQEEILKAQHHLRKNVPTLRNHFLSRLTEGTYRKNDVEAQISELEIGLQGSVQAVVMLEVDDCAAFLARYSGEGEMLVRFAVANIAGEVAADHEQMLYFQNDQNQSYLIFAADREEDLEQLIREVCQKVVTAIRKFMGIRVCAVVGETVTGAKKWEYSYRSVLAAKESRFLLRNQELFYARDVCFPGKAEQKQKQVDKAMDYIKKNYMNPEISLNAVCDYLCVSTSYFSAIFKNATGETFVESLTRVRIDKARSLLESTDMRTYEVALAAGYQDPHYFSSIFKKRMGKTPTEYVKQVKEGKRINGKNFREI